MGKSENKENNLNVVNLSKDNAKEVAAKNKKKKTALIAAVSAAAVLCIGTVAAVVAVNVNQNARPASTESAYTDSAVPGVEGNTDLSAVSQGGRPISENPFESSANGSSKADPSKASAGSTDPSKADSKVSQQSVKPEDIQFGDKVTVMGVKMKGMTLSEAYDVLQEKVMAMRDPISITVTCDGESIKLNENDFTFSTDLSDVLLDAYRLSRKEQTKPNYDATVKNGVTDYQVDCWLEESSVSEGVKKVADYCNEPPVNAHVASFDPNAKEKFTYADGHDGYTVNEKELETNIRKILNSPAKKGTFSLTKKKTAYKITIEDVKANTKLIASHHTTAMNVYNSNYNMGLALRAASGTVLQPGEVFSFNEMTGNTTNGDTHYYANGTVGGYLQSTAIVGGQYVPEYGGGICQASTTLYICAMKAGLQAIERYPHAYPSSYAPKGLDATINYGSLDMKFKNTLKMPVYIATYFYDCDNDGYDELCVEMYGPISTEYDEVVPVGWVTYAGSSSFGNKGAQVFFKNGREVKRVLLPGGSYDYKYDSYYSALNEIPADPDNGPSVSPTNTVPRIYSPNGCGSSAPIPYGTAEDYLKKIQEDKTKPAQPSKQESSKQESSKQESSKQESSKQESSKQESSKQESSKQESSKQESSKQESSKQESSKQESSKQESSKQESSKQESSKQESSKQESSKQESGQQEESSKVEETAELESETTGSEA